MPPFLPQFEAMRGTIAQAPPSEALQLLYAYFANPANENPAACEAFEIERLIGERERRLVALDIQGRAPLHPDTAYHCTRFVRRTTQCNGVVADDTGHIDALPTQNATPAPFVAQLRSALPGAWLIGVYRATLGDGFLERPARRLDACKPITMTPKPGDVLIALYFAPAPYKVRKLVWHF